MPSSIGEQSKIAGTCDPVLDKIAKLRGLLIKAEQALVRADEPRRPILEVGIRAIRRELRASSRRLRIAS